MRLYFSTTIFLFFLSINIYAQSCEIKNIVFEGAGIRGIAYAGVVDELEKHDKLKQIEKVGGTSAGAITAMMLSLSYTSNEIAEIISSTNFKKFNDGKSIFIGGILRMNKVYGWYRGEKFTKWLARLIENRTGNAEITFEELSLKGYKDLYITATCLNKQKLVVFSKENYPKMKVKDAVRISMSIPLYFSAVFIDSTGKTYKKPGKFNDLDIMVDGGIIGNFPIAIFDSIVSGSNGRKQRMPNPETVGVRIDSDLQIQSDGISGELIPMEIKNINDYVSAFYILVIENLNRNELTEDDWARTISVSSEGITPRIKKLSKGQKETLVDSGRKYTLKYIKKNCIEIE